MTEIVQKTPSQLRRHRFYSKKVTPGFKNWRKKEFDRLGGKCPRCRQDMVLPVSGVVENLLNHATVDHIVSLENGGTNARDNLRLLCARCNTRKGGR